MEIFNHLQSRGFNPGKVLHLLSLRNGTYNAPIIYRLNFLARLKFIFERTVRSLMQIYSRGVSPFLARPSKAQAPPKFQDWKCPDCYVEALNLLLPNSNDLWHLGYTRENGKFCNNHRLAHDDRQKGRLYRTVGQGRKTLVYRPTIANNFQSSNQSDASFSSQIVIRTNMVRY